MSKKIDPATPGRIDLLRGHPSTSLLATKAIAAAAAEVVGSDDSPYLYPHSYTGDRHPLHYGPDLGNRKVRDEIGRWVTEKYAIEETVSGDRINLTCGASYALMNILQQCTSPGTGYTKRAFIISPTYFIASSIFQDAGFSNLLTAIPYPPPPGSTLPSLLRTQLQKIESSTPNVPLKEGLAPIDRGPNVHKRIYRYVLYCVPTYSNPTGTTWSLATRRAIVEIAREWDILLISDDVYDFLSYEGDKDSTSPPLPRLVTLDRELVLQHGSAGRDGGLSGERFVGKDLDGQEDAGNTISNCSFSKLLGPGLRCGWVESATGRLAKQLGEGGANHSGGCPSHFMSTLIHTLVLPSTTPASSSPTPVRKVDSIISHVSNHYSQRSGAFISALKQYLPLGTTIMGGSGGYFLWVGIGPESPTSNLPTINAREVVALASTHENLVVASGDICECPGEGNWLKWGDRWVRIAVSYCDEEVGVEGIRRLGKAVERWLEGERSTVDGLPKGDIK